MDQPEPSSQPAGDTTVVSAVPVIDAPAPAAPGSLGLAPGVLLGHTYRIEALLARGGMGEVYRARHEELGSLHAIKVILDSLGEDARIVNMFQEEAKKLRRVRDDAVVGYEGLFRDEFGRRYLVMEFIDGPSLSDIMKERKLSIEDVQILRNRMARGLGAAHEKGIFHRDISPDNVIFPGGKVENAKIIDFGIAKSADPSDRTVIGDEFAGKYGYVSPEQLGMHGGKVDGRSDIYSLALVLVAALLGRKLDMGNSILQAIEARRDVPDLSAVPQPLRDEITRMLQPDPAERPANIRDLAGDNEPTHLQSLATPLGGGAVPGAGKARRGGMIGAAALAAAVVVVGGGLYAVMGTSSKPGRDAAAANPSAAPAGTGSLLPAQAQLPAASRPTLPPAEPATIPSTELAGQQASLVPAAPVATAPVGASPPLGAAGAAPPPASVGVAPPPPIAASSVPATASARPAPAVPTTVASSVASAPVVALAPVTASGLMPAVNTPASAAQQPAVPGPARPIQEAAITPPSSAALAPPKPSPAAARTSLQRLLEGYSCAQLSGQIGPDLNGTVTGFVGSAADASRLSADLASFGDARVTSDVAVHGRPHCDLLVTLASDTHVQGGAVPAIQLDRSNSPYKAGDILTVKATMARSGYLYVDYIDGAGQVVHLLPNPVEPQNRLSSGAQVVLGKPKGSTGPRDRVYEMGPPYGANMIVAIATSEPLFAQERPEVEEASTYLPAVGDRLRALVQKGAEGASSWRFFDSTP